MKKYLFLIALFSAASNVNAQTNNDTSNIEPRDEFKQAINFCPIALAFGIYSVNYERLLTVHHGIMIRGDYESIPKRIAPEGINVDAKAAIVNYRYHLCGGMNSLFVGVFGRYRVFEGDALANEIPFDFTISEFTVGANLGKRWVFNSGFNITLNAGYGHFMDQLNTTDKSYEAAQEIKRFTNDYDLY